MVIFLAKIEIILLNHIFIIHRRKEEQLNQLQIIIDQPIGHYSTNSRNFFLRFFFAFLIVFLHKQKIPKNDLIKQTKMVLRYIPLQCLICI